MSNVGELSYFLGLQIQQQRDNILLSPEKYARNLVEKFELNQATPMATPMPTTRKLQSNPGEKSVDQKLYRSMIGSLLYLTATRPDIAFSVGCCVRFQADPKESHLKAVKRIIRYVIGTVDYGLSYSMDTNNSLVAYSDADWERCVEDRKNTSGGCLYVGQNLVAWHSKKQSSQSLSTCEAENIAASTCSNRTEAPGFSSAAKKGEQVHLKASSGAGTGDRTSSE
ncbi:uncharacterized protein LOC113291877 [Papaver somniferum]|uniref:uncharacterized protein LOC113291877 n=1 Tax=Papaver somniferum TaxID=3469 RepID=UPI000E701F49|nr:uncharacterized protein LOC113291877 [Papaver somniferum]